ncbi:MAG: hypothetical protein ABIH00_02270, partial [Armatimonadota bacterium]
NKAYIRGGEIETTWHEFAHLVSDYIFNRILAGKTENKPLKSFVDKFNRILTEREKTRKIIEAHVSGKKQSSETPSVADLKIARFASYFKLVEAKIGGKEFKGLVLDGELSLRKTREEFFADCFVTYYRTLADDKYCSYLDDLQKVDPEIFNLMREFDAIWRGKENGSPGPATSAPAPIEGPPQGPKRRAWKDPDNEILHDPFSEGARGTVTDAGVMKTLLSTTRSFKEVMQGLGLNDEAFNAHIHNLINMACSSPEEFYGLVENIAKELNMIMDLVASDAMGIMGAAGEVESKLRNKAIASFNGYLKERETHSKGASIGTPVEHDRTAYNFSVRFVNEVGGAIRKHAESGSRLREEIDNMLQAKGIDEPFPLASDGRKLELRDGVAEHLSSDQLTYVNRLLNECNSMLPVIRGRIDRLQEEYLEKVKNYYASLTTEEQELNSLILGASSHEERLEIIRGLKKLPSAVIEELKKEGYRIVLIDEFNTSDGKTTMEELFAESYLNGDFKLFGIEYKSFTGGQPGRIFGSNLYKEISEFIYRNKNLAGAIDPELTLFKKVFKSPGALTDKNKELYYKNLFISVMGGFFRQYDPAKPLSEQKIEVFNFDDLIKLDVGTKRLFALIYKRLMSPGDEEVSQAVRAGRELELQGLGNDETSGIWSTKDPDTSTPVLNKRDMHMDRWGKLSSLYELGAKVYPSAVWAGSTKAASAGIFYGSMLEEKLSLIMKQMGIDSVEYTGSVPDLFVKIYESYGWLKADEFFGRIYEASFSLIPDEDMQKLQGASIKYGHIEIDKDIRQLMSDMGLDIGDWTPPVDGFDKGPVERLFKAIDSKYGWEKTAQFCKRLCSLNAEKNYLGLYILETIKTETVKSAAKKLMKDYGIQYSFTRLSSIFHEFGVERFGGELRELILWKHRGEFLLDESRHIQFFKDIAAELEKAGTELAQEFISKAAGNPVRNIVLVCIGNEVRSAGAEILLKELLRRKYGEEADRIFTVRSAGSSVKMNRVKNYVYAVMPGGTSIDIPDGYHPVKFSKNMLAESDVVFATPDSFNDLESSLGVSPKKTDPGLHDPERKKLKELPLPTSINESRGGFEVFDSIFGYIDRREALYNALRGGNPPLRKLPENGSLNRARDTIFPAEGKQEPRGVLVGLDPELKDALVEDREAVRVVESILIKHMHKVPQGMEDYFSKDLLTRLKVRKENLAKAFVEDKELYA